MKTPKHLFNVTATLLRETNAQDRQGGVTEAFTSAGTFKARVVTDGMMEDRTIHGNDVTYTATMFCGFDVTISDKDKIQIGDVVYKVGGVNNNQNAGIFQTVNLTDSL